MEAQRSKKSQEELEYAMRLVIPYVEDARDRHAVSMVCKQWYQVDSETRKHVTIALCYAARPEGLSRRFKNLKSLKLKGKPRAAMFNLIPEDWGGSVTPWVNEIVRNSAADLHNCSFRGLNSIHFRRMVVRDHDLDNLATSRAGVLEVLKLDKCSGYSTDGLLHVARFCRQLKTLFLEESNIADKDGNWLHELAVNNRALEILNFYMTDIKNIRYLDLELMARNCPSLVSLKISDCEIMNLIGFFRAATALQEFSCEMGGGGIPQDQNSVLSLPQKLCSLGLSYMGIDEMPIVFSFASVLKKLDLMYALLGTEHHRILIERCPNLEVLETRNVIGDGGLEVVGRICRQLKRLRVECGADEQEMEGKVSHQGIIAVAQGCPLLEYFAVYVSDITNEALEYIGTYSKNLNDFRLVLLDNEAEITDIPLDEGVSALLRGCTKLERFALYLRQGGLTDLGLHYIGQYSTKVTWMLLGYVGESDDGLLALSRGCPSLQKLEIRGCCFTGAALARAALHLPSLRYLWVQGYRELSTTGYEFLAMARPYWNIEFIPGRRVANGNQEGEVQLPDEPAQVLAYYSLAEPRMDLPTTVRPLHPTRLVAA